MELPEFPSYVELLRWRAQRHPDAKVYGFLRDGEELSAELSYAEFDEKARAFATGLRELAPDAERALLLYAAGLEYPVAFLGCIYAGVTAVPAYPPEPGRAVQTLERLHALVGDAKADVVLTRDDLLPGATELLGHDEGVRHVLGHGDVLAHGTPERWSAPDRLADRTAFLQYTSGSTGIAKGVVVSNANLIAHQRYGHHYFRQEEGATCVSWLPVYHDMGLIGAMLYPIYCGGRTIFMSPTSFIKRPMRWIQAIDRFRAGVSTGPNFAYELVASRAKPEEIAKLDLSCWRLSVLGAEPIRHDTVSKFMSVFAACGFRESTFMPCFGMAETTLMVSGTDLDAPVRVTSFDRATLRRRRAEATTQDEDRVRAWPMVACGQAMPAHELAIVDPGTRERLKDDQIGEIWVRGPSVAQGYFGQRELSAYAFEASIAGEDREEEAYPWFRTGDLGFVHDADLYAYGRLADLIILEGEWLAAHSVESTVQRRLDEKVVQEVIAFQSRGTGPHTNAQTGAPTQQAADADLILALSVKKTLSAEELHDCATRASAACEEIHGHAPTTVICVPLRSVGKTSSGKPRRFEWRNRYLTGDLEVLHRLQRPRS